MLKTQWTDYVDQVLNLFTTNTESYIHRHTTITQEASILLYVSPPFLTSGVVFLHANFNSEAKIHKYWIENIYSQKFQSHKGDYDLTGTQDSCFHPFSIMSYICGFGCCRKLCESIEYERKFKRYQLINNCIDNTIEWSRCGQYFINEVSV